MYTHYPLADDAYKAWTPVVAGLVTPDEHMVRLIESTQKALDSGLFYSAEVKAFVAADMNISPEVASRNKTRVEGGDFGYETFYAQKYLERRAHERALTEAENTLGLVPGKDLGTIMFNDYKLNTKCVVESIEGTQVKIVGKRGRYTMSCVTDALGIQAALARAFEQGKRKTVGLAS
jgi:hypothetical protein